MCGSGARFLDVELILLDIVISRSKIPRHNCPASSSEMPVCARQLQNCVMAWQLLLVAASHYMNVMENYNCMSKMWSRSVKVPFFCASNNSRRDWQPKDFSMPRENVLSHPFIYQLASVLHR